MRPRWIAAASAAALAASPLVAGKEGVTARLTVKPPCVAKRGDRATVGWTLGYREAGGARKPFGALRVFVQLRSASGRTTKTYAPGDGSGSGAFSATAALPAGRLHRIRIGLSGTTDIYFPIENAGCTTARAGG